MPAEHKLPDVLAAVKGFGSRGGNLEEVAISAGVSSKTARRHLKELLRMGSVVREQSTRPGSRRQVWSVAEEA